MHVDRAALDAALSQLDGSGLAELELEDALARVVDATRNVFVVTGTGLMFVSEDSVLRYVAATDEAGRTLEVAQAEVGTGPCVEALVNDRVVRVDDMASDPRWPEVSERVVPAGVRSVLGLPVSVAGATLGSLNVYCDERHEWDESEEEALAAFAHLVGALVASAVLSARRGSLVQQLQHALEHRVAVERAVGVLMGRDGLDAIAAFNRLRDVARSRREKVGVLAQRFLESGGSELG